MYLSWFLPPTLFGLPSWFWYFYPYSFFFRSRASSYFRSASSSSSSLTFLIWSSNWSYKSKTSLPFRSLSGLAMVGSAAFLFWANSYPGFSSWSWFSLLEAFMPYSDPFSLIFSISLPVMNWPFTSEICFMVCLKRSSKCWFSSWVMPEKAALMAARSTDLAFLFWSARDWTAESSGSAVRVLSNWASSRFWIFECASHGFRSPAATRRVISFGSWRFYCAAFF